MAKRRAKKMVKAPDPVPESKEEPQVQAYKPQLMDHEIEGTIDLGFLNFFFLHRIK